MPDAYGQNYRSEGLVGVLDIGTFKTACLVGLMERGRPVRIVGVAQIPSRGVRSGTIVDLAAAEDTVRSAIAEAEAMCGCRLDSIDAAVTCGQFGSVTFQVRAAIAEGVVTQSHVSRLYEAARTHAERPGRSLLHLCELGFAVDGSTSADNPVGLAASRMAGDFHAVTCETAPLANLIHVIERCYLAPGELVATPLASALAVTSIEDRRAGIAVIDMGCGSTALAVFRDGRLIYSDTLPAGGAHITTDIACALQAPLEEAERIKTVYGTLLNALSNEHDVFSYATARPDEGEVQRATKADLARIIQARVAAVLEQVRERLAAAGLADIGRGGIVVTGGSSQIPGLAAFAESVLKRPVREGRPHRLSGLPPLMGLPAFAGVVGLLEARIESVALSPPAHRDARPGLGYLGRVGRWLKDGF